MARSGKQERQQGHVPRTPPSIKGLTVSLFGHLLVMILHFLFIGFCYIFWRFFSNISGYRLTIRKC